MKPHPFTSTLILAAVALSSAAGLRLQAEPPPEKAAYLGVVVAPADDTLREQLKLRRGVGLSVQSVMPDSPAATAGVKTHDLIEKLDDQLLFNPPQLASLVRSLASGDKVTLTLIRQGSPQTIEVTLGETEIAETGKSLFSVWEAQRGLPRIETLFDDRFGKTLKPSIEAKVRPKPVTFLGLELAPVEPALAAQLGLEPGTGALVRLVVQDSPAATAGLEPHDVVTQLDGKPVRDPADLSARIREHQKGDKVTLKLLRAGKPVELEATLGEKALTDFMPIPGMLESYRVVPGVRVLPGTSAAGEVVVRFDAEGEPDGARTERRVIMRTGEAGKGGGVRVETAPSPQEERSSLQRKLIVIKTDEGLTTTVQEEDARRVVTVKDAQGKVLFDGPVQSPEDQAKLPREVRESLEKIEKVGKDIDVGPQGKDAIREFRLAPAPATPEAI